MRSVTSFFAGILFALGLGLSGMMNPVKVRGFLDLTRQWDPSLAFVMIGAILIYAISFKLIMKRSKPVWNVVFSIPTKQVVDRKLVIGASLFGIGWGLSGICPGPALANLATGSKSVILFVLMMLVGIILAKMLEKLR